MSSLQRVASNVAEIGSLTASYLAQAAGSLVGSATREAGQLSLEELSCRLEGALQVLRGDGPAGTMEGVSLELAEAIVRSYTFDEARGVSTCTIPAGVSDVEAMIALNEYFRRAIPRFERVAIFAGDFDWYENLPKNFPDHCKERDYTQAREVVVQGLVEATIELGRSEEGDALAEQGLVFSDPRDQAIAAALHACQHDGADLFQGLWARGAVPGFALGAAWRKGIRVYGYDDDSHSIDVVASGSPAHLSR